VNVQTITHNRRWKVYAVEDVTASSHSMLSLSLCIYF